MKHAFFGRALPAFTLAAAVLTSLPAAAGPYNSLVVFGDSLSDSGNAAALGAYDPNQVVLSNSYIPGAAYLQQRTGMGVGRRGGDRRAATTLATERYELRAWRRDYQ